jgi:hypothetical protein
VIARLAQAQLSAKASAEVARLLALEPGATLESISIWAVEHRNPASAPWHYVNFPRGSCVYDAQRNDKGGNTYQLQAFMPGSNLHAVWDSGLIRQLDEDTAGMAARLRKLVLPDTAKGQSPAHAAEKSCRLVATPGFYPNGLVDLGYLQRCVPLMEQRLAMAGARLSALLKHALS